MDFPSTLLIWGSFDQTSISGLPFRSFFIWWLVKIVCPQERIVKHLLSGLKKLQDFKGRERSLSNNGVGYSGTTRNLWENICPPKQLVHPSAQVNLFVIYLFIYLFIYFSCTGFGGEVSEVGGQDRVGSPCVNQEILRPTCHIQLHPSLQSPVMVICDRKAGWSRPLQSCWTILKEGLVLDLEALEIGYYRVFPSQGPAQFYPASKGIYIFEVWGRADPRKRGARFWLLSLCFFSSPWACPV